MKRFEYSNWRNEFARIIGEFDLRDSYDLLEGFEGGEDDSSINFCDPSIADTSEFYGYFRKNFDRYKGNTEFLLSSIEYLWGKETNFGTNKWRYYGFDNFTPFILSVIGMWEYAKPSPIQVRGYKLRSFSFNDFLQVWLNRLLYTNLHPASNGNKYFQAKPTEVERVFSDRYIYRCCTDWRPGSYELHTLHYD